MPWFGHLFENSRIVQIFGKHSHSIAASELRRDNRPEGNSGHIFLGNLSRNSSNGTQEISMACRRLGLGYGLLDILIELVWTASASPNRFQ